MIRLLLLGIVCFAVCHCAIRCYEGQQTVPGVAPPFQETFCPTSDYCFNNYVKRHHNGDDSYTISKSCGQPGKCFETGCEGPVDEKRCCCVGDLCNSGYSINLLVSVVSAVLYSIL